MQHGHYKIMCVGAGYVGGPTMAVIADKCPDIKVVVYDFNDQLIARWKAEDLPIYEAGLNEIIHRTLNKNLFFTSNFEEAIDGANMIFVAVNTPTKTIGHGKDMACDIKNLELIIRSLSRHFAGILLKDDVIIVEKSTVPVKTGQWIERLFIEEQTIHPSNKDKLVVLSNPEFLAEGTAIQDLFYPDRVVIGGASNLRAQAGMEQLKQVYAHWVPEERIITSHIFSSELGKLVANAFLAQRVSSINSISMICEKTGAVIDEISAIIGADKRIGKAYLKPSVGFGGSCLQKDVLHLVYLSESLGLKEVADYWRMVISINDYQKNRFTDLVFKKFFHNLIGKVMCVYGIAFKKDTHDARASAALQIVYNLLQEGAIIHVWDPKATKNELILQMKYMNLWEEKFDKEIIFFENPYGASVSSHAILILTEWDEFRDYDYKRIYTHMSKPAFLFDGRRILDVPKLQHVGFEVYTIGQHN